MIEVEVFGAELARDAPPLAEVRRLCVLAAASRGGATTGTWRSSSSTPSG